MSATTHTTTGTITGLTDRLRRGAAFLLLGLALLAGGCSTMSSYLPDMPEMTLMEPEKREAVAPYSAHSLMHYQLGREYMAGGRYELAREHILLAMAGARDDALRDQAAADLEALDRIIVSRR